MRPPCASELLQAWEWGVARSPVERAVALAALVAPDLPVDAVAALPVGARDARLLALREQTFGPGLEAVATCPACGDELELDFEVADVRAAAVRDAAWVRSGSHEVDVRAPSSADVAASIAGTADVAAGRQALLERCVLAARCDGVAAEVRALPAAVVDACVAHLGDLDPQADVLLALSCPSCRHGWQAPFDVAAYLWSELEAWAHHLLVDVHTLASTYGWSEGDILALSPWRRRLYLQAVSR